MTMKKKEDVTRRPRKKLTLSKETLRDLTPKKDKAHTLKGGGRTNSLEGVIKCN